MDFPRKASIGDSSKFIYALRRTPCMDCPDPHFCAERRARYVHGAGECMQLHDVVAAWGSHGYSGGEPPLLSPYTCNISIIRTFNGVYMQVPCSQARSFLFFQPVLVAKQRGDRATISTALPTTMHANRRPMQKIQNYNSDRREDRDHPHIRCMDGTTLIHCG